MWQLVFTAEERPAEPAVLPAPKPSALKPLVPPKKKKPVSLTVQITPTRGEPDDDDD